MADGRLNHSLDELIEAQGSGGRAPRSGGPVGVSGQRVQPYGGAPRGGAGPRGGPRPPGVRISETLDNSATPQNAIKVGGNQDAKDIAARLCESCRTGDPPALLTIGNQSINQAVKAIAIARAELAREGVSLSFQPAFRHTDRTKPLIAFYVAKERAAGPGYGGQGSGGGQADDVTLTVASQSKIVPVAGAIAGKVRENLKTSLLAIGVDAVTNAVLAVGNARLFLEQDNYDIRVEPEFEKVEKNGQLMTSMKLSLVAEAL